ncbi:MAG: AsmA family protein [Acidobacteria bacterium]|nr:AsmA family protein [Acidobacteriota bacterium]
MSALKKSLVALAGLLGLLAVAAAVFVYTFDVNRYRGLILEQLGRSVNRPVEAAELELRLLPLRLRLNRVRIPEAPGFAGEEFIRAEAVQFDFSLGALLRGETRVQALELVRPEVWLRQNAAGEWNLATLAAEEPAEKPASSPGPAAAPVRNWRLREGTVVIERAGRTPLRLSGVELAATDLSATEAFPFRLAVGFDSDSRVSASGRLGPLDLAAPARTPFQAELTLENFRPAALASLVSVPAELARLGALAGALKLSSTPDAISLSGTVTLLGAQAADNLALELSARLPADWSRVELGDTVVKYAGARVAGQGSLRLGAPIRFDLKLTTAEADLGALARIPSRLGYPLPPGLPPATGKLTAELKASGASDAWQLTGTAKIRDLGVKLEGFAQPLRVAALDLTLEPDRITAAPFSVSPEPGVSLILAGSVSGFRSRPVVEARVGGGEVPLAPLLALGARFGVKTLSEGQQVTGFVQPALKLAGPLAEPARMSYGGTLKFRALSLKFAELAKPVEVPAVVVEFDRERLIAAPFTISPEPGVNLTLAATVDDYRGQARLKARVTGEDVPVGPLLALASAFGANPLGEGQKLSGRVRPAIDLSGPLAEPAKIAYEGTLAFRDFSLTTPQLPQPLRVPALELALSPTRLAAAPFAATLGEELRARANFRLDNYRTRPALEAHVETDGADLEVLVGLARVLGSDPLPGGRASGRVTAAVDLRGLLGEKASPLDLSGRVQLAGASVTLAALTQPLGIEQAEVEFASNRLQVTNLRLAAAGTKLEGSLRVDNFDAPRVNFDLRGDRLDVMGLQALVGAQPAAPAAPPKRRRLSQLFLPVVHAQEKGGDWFARLSGRGRLEFDRVTHGTLTLAPFVSPLSISNRVVTCEPIEFGLYDGGGRGRLVVNLQGAEPLAEFNGLLRNVDANKLLSENSESKNRLHGRLGGAVTVRFAGSERPAILRSAVGQGALSLVNGRFAQLNLSRELVALGQLAGLSTEQRDTPIEDMTTQFQIADGWVRTDDLTLRTPDLTMTALGGFSLEDELAFASTATFTPEASQRLSSRGGLGAVVGGFFTDEQGRVMIPFLIRGTFAAPKLELDLGRLMEMKLGRGRDKPAGTLGDILDRLRKRKQPPK